MVAATVDFASMVEVDEVHQQLAARGAHEALRVPTGTQACSAGEYGDVPASDLLPALPNDRETLPPTWSDGRGSAKACRTWAFPWLTFVTGSTCGATFRRALPKREGPLEADQTPGGGKPQRQALLIMGGLKGKSCPQGTGEIKETGQAQ